MSVLYFNIPLRLKEKRRQTFVSSNIEDYDKVVFTNLWVNGGMLKEGFFAHSLSSRNQIWNICINLQNRLSPCPSLSLTSFCQ